MPTKPKRFLDIEQRRMEIDLLRLELFSKGAMPKQYCSEKAFVQCPFGSQTASSSPVPRWSYGISGRTNASIGKIFERVVLLERDKRSGEAFMSHIDEVNWPFVEPRRFRVVGGRQMTPPQSWRGEPGAWCHFRSHLRVIEDALTDAVNSVLILEDTARFDPDLAQKASGFLGRLPGDWCQVYLGGVKTGGNSPARVVGDGVTQPRRVVGTFAYALHRRFLKLLYAFLANDVEGRVDGSPFLASKFSEIQAAQRFAVYAPTSSMAFSCG